MNRQDEYLRLQQKHLDLQTKYTDLQDDVLKLLGWAFTPPDRDVRMARDIVNDKLHCCEMSDEVEENVKTIAHLLAVRTQECATVALRAEPREKLCRIKIDIPTWRVCREFIHHAILGREIT